MRFFAFVKKHRISLFLIIFLGFSFFLRTWQLDTNPAGFFCDEAKAGIEAWSIFQTGKDTKGNLLPLFFSGIDTGAYGPYAIYSTVPLLPILGLNEISVRLPSVIISCIELYIFYLLLKLLIPQKFALVGTLLYSIAPWHFHLSRNSVGDFTMWTLLTTILIYLLIKSLRSTKPEYALYTGIVFGLLMYSYPPAQLTNLLFLFFNLPLIIFKKGWRYIFILLISFLIMIIPYIRFQITNSEMKNRVIFLISEKNNKTTDNFFERTSKKYLSHFNYEFLFKTGDATYPGQNVTRHSIYNLGLLFPYQIVLIISGLIWIIVKLIQKKLEYLPILLLLVIYPVTDSLIIDPIPYATRSYVGVIPFHILIALGLFVLYYFIDKTKFGKLEMSKLMFGLIFIFFLEYSFFTLIFRLNQNPLYTSDFWGWQYGPRHIIGYFKDHQAEYDELIMEPAFNAPHIFFDFYAPNQCQKCLVGDLTSFNPEKKQLFALTPNTIRQKPQISYSTKKVLYYPDGNVAFKLIEVENL